MSALSFDQQRIFNEALRRKRAKNPLLQMQADIGDLNANAMPGKDAAMAGDVLAGTLPAYKAGPTGLRIGQKAAEYGVDLYAPQHKQVPWQPDLLPQSDIQPDGATQKPVGPQRDFGAFGRSGKVQGSPGYRLPGQSAPPGAPPLELTNWGTETRFASQEAQQPQRPMTEGERKRGLNTPATVQLSSGDIAQTFARGAGAIGQQFEDGQIINSADGAFYRNDAKAGHLTPVVFDPSANEWVTRSDFADKWIEAHPNDAVARDYIKAQKDWDNAVQQASMPEGMAPYMPGTIEQSVGAAEAKLNALANVMLRRGSTKHMEQQGQESKPLTPSEELAVQKHTEHLELTLRNQAIKELQLRRDRDGNPIPFNEQDIQARIKKLRDTVSGNAGASTDSSDPPQTFYDQAKEAWSSLSSPIPASVAVPTGAGQYVLPQPKSPEEWKALPKGTHYRLSDGIERIKQ